MFLKEYCTACSAVSSLLLAILVMPQPVQAQHRLSLVIDKEDPSWDLSGPVTGIDDINGDGIRDIVAGDASGTYLFSGKTGELLCTTDKKASNDIVEVPDVNGDGTADLFTIEESSGDAYLISGSDLTTFHVFSNEGIGSASDVARAGDINDDGTPDLLVTLPESGSQGKAHIYDGDDGTLLRTLTPTNSNDTDLGLYYIPETLTDPAAGVGDLNDDGIREVAILAETTVSQPSEVLYVFSGSDGSVEKRIELGVEECYPATPTGIGDVDGDGVPDLALGCPFSESPSRDNYGKVHVFSGRDYQKIYTAESPSPTKGEKFGLDIAEIGDVDGDGAPDLLVGSGFDPGGNYKDFGAVFLHSGSDGQFIRRFDTDYEDGYMIPVALNRGSSSEASRFLVLPRSDDYQSADVLLVYSEPASKHSKMIQSSGSFDFGSTGVDLSFSSVSSGGEMTVAEYSTTPMRIGWLKTSGVNVSSYTYVVTGESSFEFGDAEVRVAVSSMEGVDDPASVTMYSRSEPWEGTFDPLTTRIDENGTPNDISDDEIYATVSSFGEFAFASSTEPLPVELARFDARLDGSDVRLSWTTASEQNNAGFRVQRRSVEPSDVGQSDGWVTVGRVNGAGTTTESQSYFFSDTEVPYQADRLAYRLKQVDTDGSTNYSKRVEVHRRTESVRLLGTQPNPARKQATLRFAVPEAKRAVVHLYDALGRRIRTVVDRRVKGRETERIDVADLSSGVYFVRLRADGKIRTKRLTVVE